MEAKEKNKARSGYGLLSAQLALNFIVMYLAMYGMIASLSHFYLNLNNVYMTMMMTAPMAVIMLFTMRSMFPSRAAKLVVVGLATFVFLVGFVGIRTQAAVGNVAFLRSMIPHHSGAILMCEKASITDPEIVALCKNIISSQQAEISQMQDILRRY